MTTATRSAIVLSRAALDAWCAALVAAGKRVVAPVATAGGVEYEELQPGHGPSGLDQGLPRQSPKATWFPRTEPILKLERQGQEWAINDPPLDQPHSVLFAARPCDAVAPEILAPLFGWDWHDPFFEKRRARLAIVVMGCAKPVDDACFCTSVGTDPAGAGIGDVTLTALPDGAFAAAANTDAGDDLLTLAQSTGSPDTATVVGLHAAARAAVPKRIDTEQARAGLAARFTDPMWERVSRACIACGTCAFSCPVCHCFDIQEEMCGCRGVRQKNWDACAFPHFTIHTSGHNPRPDQGARWRQRLNHKFRYYPEKFGHTLCTGCGRCLRLCPAGMDMLADLQAVTEDATPISGPTVPAPVAGPAVPVTQQRDNPYRPYRMRVAQVRDETPDVRTLRLEFLDPADAQGFTFQVGQFGLYSAFGEGESTFCVASSPSRHGYIECTFRQAGRVTRALRRLDVGDVMGFRGPYGNRFPVETWKGKNLLFIAGGIALPPMRCVIQWCLDHREDYRDITIVYGARTSRDLVYKDELAEWERRGDVNLWLGIDWKPRPDGKGLSDQASEDGWRPINQANPSATVLDPAHRRWTAFVPQLVEAVQPSPVDTVAVLCGPPVMINFTMQALKKLGFAADNVFTTLENRMKCGIGKCGRCNVGPVYVCKEGPVFTAAEIAQLPPEL
jgi:sulfhydrogenase subunit gamma (sulfur reductase)